MRSRGTSFILLGVVVVLSTALPGRAQQKTSTVVKLRPVRTHEAKPPKANFEVLHMMATGIQVRSVVNGYEVHTFAYAEPIRARMQSMLEQGTGYQYGDKIEIVYEPNTQVALRIKG